MYPLNPPFTGPDQGRVYHSSYGTVPGAPLSDGKTFFGFHLYFARRFCKIFKSTRSPTQCISGPGYNMIGKRNHLQYHFSITIHLHLDSFYATIYFRKKNHLEEMLFDPINEFELRGPGPLGRTCTSKTGYFHDKTKIFKKYLRVDYYLLLKYCTRQCTLLPPI